MHSGAHVPAHGRDSWVALSGQRCDGLSRRIGNGDLGRFVGQIALPVDDRHAFGRVLPVIIGAAAEPIAPAAQIFMAWRDRKQMHVGGQDFGRHLL